MDDSRRILIEAIESRSCVTFDYHGHHRAVVPAAVGEHATTGNVVLRGYQFGGSSSSRAVPLWDLFRVAEITNLEIAGGPVTENPPLYKRGDAHISPIDAEL